MFYPNSEGILNIGGKLAGGHAYVINGVDTKRQLFRIKNNLQNLFTQKIRINQKNKVNIQLKIHNLYKI